MDIMNWLKGSRLFILLLVCVIVFCGCDSSKHNENDKNKILEYNVVLYGATARSDAQILCYVEKGTVAEILTYKLSEDRQSWISSFGITNAELNELDFIAIKNNYSKNYIPHLLTVEADEKVESSVMSKYKTKHNMAIYSYGYYVENNDPLYEELDNNYPNMYGEFIYFDSYQLSYDNTKIIGYQILSENQIDDSFRQQLEKLTIEDLSALPDQSKYGYYQLFMITLNFHHPS